MKCVRGIVVLDATAIQHLARPASVDAIARNCRAAHLRVWPSVVNVLEILRHPNTEVRSRLLAALDAWRGEFPLLPWPTRLLRLDGEAALRGDRAFSVRSSAIESVFSLERNALEAAREDAAQFLRQIDDLFVEAHTQVREEMQAALRQTSQAARWPDGRAWLEHHWADEENPRHFASQIWSALRLAGNAPWESLRTREIWRLLLDTYALAVYDRTVRREQVRNAAGQVDLFQLLYLTTHTLRRIFVTDDRSLREMARTVLVGRFPNVRVMNIEEFMQA